MSHFFPSSIQFMLDCCFFLDFQPVYLTVVFIKKRMSVVDAKVLLSLAPVEWLTVITPFKAFQIYSEIRQGLFLTVLLTFWLFFAGEHIAVSSCLIAR